MTSVTIAEAWEKLVELIQQLKSGEELVITQDDQPVAKLVGAAVPERRPRRFGTLRGTVLSMEHFDDPLDEFAEHM